MNLKTRKKAENIGERRALPRIDASMSTGLTEEQAKTLRDNGYANVQPSPPSKTVGQIIFTNVFTYFNMVFFILAGCVIAVGSYRNLMFMPIVITNMIIGVVQEIRSKKTLDKLTILSAPKGTVIREGAQKSIGTDEMVRDDVVIFNVGNQIYADAIVMGGEVKVNEALVTGEADEVTKVIGDTLLSGSFVVAGSCHARLDRVGYDSFASRLTVEAKKYKKKERSEMMRSLTRLVRTISFVIIPLGALLFYRQHYGLGLDLEYSVVATVAALVGMIPEGLYLLVSVALAVSVMRLAQKRTLVHEMGCIETLARVDVLCVDKTGTITENKMIVEDIATLCEDRFTEDDIRMIMSDYVGNMGDDNETMLAMKRYFTGEVTQKARKVMPFSSGTKYGGVSYDKDETYLLGAPEFILRGDYSEYREKVESYSQKGCRVLLLALYDGDLGDEGINGEIMPLSLILLNNKIRDEAPDTFKFFAAQGVAIKVISGDNPVAVSQIAKQAGIENAEKYVDAGTLDTDKKIRAAATEYTVFGRVTPEQKRKLIRAMKAAGHTVAMTGDGVNDVLALKEADCSIAMASGSDVASQVSQLVLMNSNFSAMPSVVMEGRRVINNIERSASLFLVKNIFSFFLAVITLFAEIPYPITPAQLSLASTVTIGIPSFFLALEPNKRRVEGHFLKNVVSRALPAGLTNVVLVLGAIIFTLVFEISTEELSTISATILGVVGLIMLYRVCLPFNKMRRWLWAAMAFSFAFSLLFLKDLFALTSLTLQSGLILAVFAALALPTMNGISSLCDKAAKELSGKIPFLQKNKRVTLKPPQ